MKSKAIPFLRFSSTAMNEAQLNYFKNLRIYKNRSTFALLNHLTINKALSYDLVVDNSYNIYKKSNSILGTTITNKLVEGTIGQVFTAGKNLEALEKYLSKEKDLTFIIDYCCEALEGLENDEAYLDSNALVMKSTVESCGKIKDKHGMIIAIKVSGLCEKNLLVKINQGRQRIQNFFSPMIDINKIMTLEQIFTKLNEQGLVMNEFDQKEFSQILDMKPGQNTVDQTRWLYKHFSQLTQEEKSGLEKVTKRFTSFLDPMRNTPLRAVVDAEQTYFQLAIDSISEQMEAHYNKKECVKVMNTLQCYLKASSSRMEYELQKANTFRLPIGMKFVRGAYMVEEAKIAKNSKMDSPINSTYEETNSNYNRCVENYFKANIPNSAIVVASHNAQSCEFVKQLMGQFNINKNSDAVTFAQLYGLADQLTFKLRDEGYRVAKYVPFGKTEIMIPYLIRRAQESKQMFEGAKIQTALLKDEFKKRIFK